VVGRELFYEDENVILNHFRMMTQTDREIIFHGDIQKEKKKEEGKRQRSRR
jgi:hypothetical protein